MCHLPGDVWYISGKVYATECGVILSTMHDIKTFRKVWQYKHADFDRANDLLMDLDLENIIDPSDMESSWLSWKRIFKSNG